MRRTAFGLASALAGLVATAATAGGFATLDGHGGPVKGVAVSPDGSLALTASFDNALGLWSLPGGERLGWLDGHEAAVNDAVFLRDGRAVTVGDDFDAIVWDLDARRPLRRLEGHRGKVMDAAVSVDGAWIATASWDGTVGLWPVAGGPPRFLDGHEGAVNDVAFADETTLYSASADGTVRVWDLGEAAPEGLALIEQGFGVNKLVLDTRAGWLAYGAVDGVTRVRDLATGAILADLTAERRPVLAMAYDPQGGRLAIGDGEGYVMVVSTGDWSVLRDFHATARGPVWALAWEGGGEGRLLAAGISDSAAVWPIGDEAAPRLAGTERRFHADPATMSNGERQFVRKCSVCHSLTPDGQRRAGPTLHGVFGRAAGSVAGYRYSEALSESDIVWEAESIARLFRDGPDVVTPGSKMPVQRIARAEDRRDLIDYLRAHTR